jgi:hypothetical protein
MERFDDKASCGNVNNCRYMRTEHSFCDIPKETFSCAAAHARARYRDYLLNVIARKGRHKAFKSALFGAKWRCLHPPPVCIKVELTVAHHNATIFFCDWVFSIFCRARQHGAPVSDR